MTDIKPGSLLVAHPDLDDDFFSFTNVLIFESTRFGYQGLVLNKLSSTTLSEAIAVDDWPYSNNLYKGGPLSPQALFLIHSSDWASSNTIVITKDISISSDPSMIQRMMSTDTPSSFRFVSGVCAWKPSQLEQELGQGNWLTTQSNENIVFESDGETQWKNSINLCAKSTMEQYF